MQLLTSLDIIHITAMQADLMPDTCTLREISQTGDGSGGWTEGTSDTAGVPCRLMYGSGNEAIQANTVMPSRQYTVTIPATYTLTQKTRVIKAGITYEVTSVNEGASMQTAKRATLTRVEA